MRIQCIHPGVGLSVLWTRFRSDFVDENPETRYPGTIAFLHHPHYSWETDFTSSYIATHLNPAWELFYAAGADVMSRILVRKDLSVWSL